MSAQLTGQVNGPRSDDVEECAFCGGQIPAPQTTVALAAATIDEARDALLHGLVEDLEAAAEMVSELAGDPRGLEAWPIVSDARSMLRQVQRVVTALDDLGWAAAAAGQGPSSPLLALAGGRS